MAIIGRCLQCAPTHLLQKHYYPQRRHLSNRRVQLYTVVYSEQGKCKEIYKYNYGKNSLDLVASMLTERSSHALCYLD